MWKMGADIMSTAWAARRVDGLGPVGQPVGHHAVADGHRLGQSGRAAGEQHQGGVLALADRRTCPLVDADDVGPSPAPDPRRPTRGARRTVRPPPRPGHRPVRPAARARRRSGRRSSGPSPPPAGPRPGWWPPGVRPPRPPGRPCPRGPPRRRPVPYRRAGRATPAPGRWWTRVRRRGRCGRGRPRAPGPSDVRCSRRPAAPPAVHLVHLGLDVRGQALGTRPGGEELGEPVVLAPQARDER